jgi:hypothetical protein
MTANAADSPWPIANDWQYQELSSLAQRACVPASKLEPILGTLWPVYFGYDAEAARAQRRFRRGAVAVYCLSGCAVTVAIGQFLFMPTFHVAISLEVMAMVAAMLLLSMSHRQQWKRQWLTNRYAAEQLRIRMYLAIVPTQGEGAAMDPSSTLPFYSQLGAGLPADAEKAMHASCLKACAVEDADALKKWLCEGWIASQIRFHRNAIRRHKRASLNARRATIGLFALTLIAAMLHALGLGHAVFLNGHLHTTLTTNLIVFLSIALPAIASAVHAISDLLDHERIAVRSEGMARILELLAAEIQAASRLEQVRELARRTEQVMAIENFEWLAALTFRLPPRTPI